MGDGKIVEHEEVFLTVSVKMLKYSLALFHSPLIKTPTENEGCQ